MNAYRCPAVCDGACAGTLFAYYLGIAVVVICSEECISGCIESVNGCVYGEYCVVITALSVLGLVIDSRTDHFNFTGGEVTLEVSGVVIRIPQTPLYI